MRVLGRGREDDERVCYWYVEVFEQCFHGNWCTLSTVGAEVSNAHGSTQRSTPLHVIYKAFKYDRVSVQFSSKWYLCTRKCPYALHPVSQNFPQSCF